MSTGDLIQESCEKVVLWWRKIIWTNPFRAHAGVHSGHRAIKIKGSLQGWCKLYILLCIGLTQKGLASWSQCRQHVFLKWLYTGKRKPTPVSYLKPHKFIIITLLLLRIFRALKKIIVFQQWLSVCLLWGAEMATFERICLNQRKIACLKHKSLVGQWQAHSSCNILHS